jgi:hypothetical protein
LENIKSLIIWLLVVSFGLPIHGLQAERVESSSQTAALSSEVPSLSEQIFDELRSQSFRLVVNGKEAASFRYAERYGDLVEPLGLNVKDSSELTTEIFRYSKDNKGKIRIRFQQKSLIRPSRDTKHSGSEAIIDPDNFNIISVVEHENAIAFLNEDGTIYGIDKAALKRQFGRSDVKFFRIGKIEPKAGKNYELLFNLNPFSANGFAISPELDGQAGKRRMTDGALFVVERNGGTPAVIDIFEPRDFYRALALPTIALALSVAEQKPGVQVALGELQEEYAAWAQAHPDFLNASGLSENIRLIRSTEAEAVSTSLQFVQTHYAQANDNRSFSLADWIKAGHLQLSSTSKGVLANLLSDQGDVARDVLSPALEDLQSQIGPLLQAEPATEHGEFLRALDAALKNGSSDEKVERARYVLAASEVPPDELVASLSLNETSGEVLKAVLSGGTNDLWAPSSRILVAALYEFSQSLTEFLRLNPLHPERPALEKALVELAQLGRIRDERGIDKITERLRRISEEQTSLLDFIAAAQIDSDGSFQKSSEELMKIHPSNQSFREKVRDSKIVKFLQMAQEAILSGPNLLMAAGMIALYLTPQFSAEYKALVGKSMMANYGLLVLFMSTFGAAGKFLLRGKNGAYAMSKFGIPIYGGFLSRPLGVTAYEARGQKNATYAASHGLRPTRENGGLVADPNDFEAVEAARSKLVRLVQARERMRAVCRNESLRAVLKQRGVELKAETWQGLMEEWQRPLVERFKSEDREFDARRRQALLSADPLEISRVDAEIELAKFQRSLRQEAEETRIKREMTILGDQLEVELEARGDAALMRLFLPSGSSRHDDSVRVTRASARSLAQGLSQRGSFSTWLSSSLRGFRIKARHGETYYSNRILTYPVGVFRAAQKAVVRQDVANTIYSNWRMDMVVQFLTLGLWDGWPFQGMVKSLTGHPLPVRADPEQPAELLGQAGIWPNEERGIKGLLWTHKGEFGNLRQQDAAYSIVATTRAQSELGGGNSFRNPFAPSHYTELDHEYRPHAKENRSGKSLAFWKTFSKFLRASVQWRKIGVERYFRSNFNNVGVFGQAQFAIHCLLNGLIGGYSVDKLISQFIFGRGMSVWVYGWPWAPLNRGITAVSKEVSDTSAAFLSLQGRFEAEVEHENWANARALLLDFEVLYRKNGVEFSPAASLGKKTVDEISPEDLKAVREFLRTSKELTYSDVSPWVNDLVVGFGGGTITTLLGVPFFVFLLAAKNPWAQIAWGMGGLFIMYPAVFAAFRLYDSFAKRTFDQKRIRKEGAEEAERLSRPESILEISARLDGEMNAELRELQKSDKIPSLDKPAKAAEIRQRYSTAQTALKARREATSPPSSPGGTGSCVGGLKDIAQES